MVTKSRNVNESGYQTLRGKCPYTESFLVRIFLYLDQKNSVFGHVLRSEIKATTIVRNTDSIASNLQDADNVTFIKSCSI